MNEQCITRVGTERWINFVEDSREEWDKINKESKGKGGDMTSLTLINPPRIKTLKLIIQKAKNRYNPMFGQYLLIEFGIKSLYGKLKEMSVNNSFRLAVLMRDRFSLVVNEANVPTTKIDIYNISEVDKGRIVLSAIQEQIARIKAISIKLGYLDGGMSEIGFLVLVCSISDMLGACCEGDFDKYCIEYPKKLDSEIRTTNVWNNFIRDNLNKVLEDIIGKILYYKNMGEPYGIKFDAKIRCAYKLSEYFSENEKLFENYEYEGEIIKKIVKFDELLEKYQDLSDMLKMPDRHLELNTVFIEDNKMEV